jgi:general secretion pathway protein L
MARRILGLDIGSHAVKAVEFRQTLRGVEVAQLRALPLDDPSPALATELRDFIQMHDLPTEHVVVSLAGDRVSTRRLSFPFRDRRKIGPAVPFEVEAQVPFDLRDFFVDWEIIGQHPDRTEVTATLAPRSEVALLLDTIREAGINPRTVEAEGLVLGNLTAIFELEGTRLLADIGHRKTTLCLCVNGRAVAARTVPVAGLAVTEALARERGTGEVEAESSKIAEGVFGGPGRQQSPAGIAVLDELAREMVRTLGSLETATAATDAPPLSEIVLMGGTAHLHRLDEFLAERTGLQITRLALPPAEMGAALVAGGDPVVFAPAIALAIRGSMQARTRMNFRQDELARRVDLRKLGRELRWTAGLAGLALLLACASAITNIALQSRRAEQVEQQTARLYQEAFPGRPVPGSVLKAMQEAVRSVQQRADTLGIYRGNLSALQVLAEISSRVPTDLDVIFEELSIDRQVIQIKGHSPSFGSVDRLRAELAKYAPFSEIAVGDITSDARRGGQTFNVRISLSSGPEAS